ncbi:hypothetical protein BS47DRAFT_1367731 [Hydnum rufescens UP504]|uniref:Uncharacterized protein n=1 Tax=Hydnum rufescens UP504 TaxID=1448309 RepID=A0A9P6AIF4_9AGAM|nr:hypothetical protein BS47DRAFT_1367731 [Hydnum rufescens UP504]
MRFDLRYSGPVDCRTFPYLDCLNSVLCPENRQRWNAEDACGIGHGLQTCLPARNKYCTLALKDLVDFNAKTCYPVVTAKEVCIEMTQDSYSYSHRSSCREKVPEIRHSLRPKSCSNPRKLALGRSKATKDWNPVGLKKSSKNSPNSSAPKNISPASPNMATGVCGIMDKTSPPNGYKSSEMNRPVKPI